MQSRSQLHELSLNCSQLVILGLLANDASRAGLPKKKQWAAAVGCQCLLASMVCECVRMTADDCREQVEAQQLPPA
jgi:uncharacterized YccA/Bax inhibitor family protein